MQYCKKCNKFVENKEDIYRDLCPQCYYDFLIERIENAKPGEVVFEPYKKPKDENKLIKFLKNLFKID